MTIDVRVIAEKSATSLFKGANGYARCPLSIQALDDPTRFLLFEQYVDELASETHSASAHFQRLVLEAIVPQLVERVRERFVAE